MEQNTLIKKTMQMARTGDRDAFQSFYILTVEETYAKVYALVKEEELASQLTIAVYTELYRHASSLPVGEQDLIQRIEDEIYHQAELAGKLDLGKIDIQSGYEKISEAMALTLWLKIEENAEIVQVLPEEEKSGIKSYIYSLLKICVTITTLVLTVMILYRSWMYFGSNERSAEELASIEAETIRQTEVPVPEEEKLTPGWERRPDGRLYYVTHEGKLAVGQFMIGKQQLTFSRDGALTLIGANRECDNNQALSFDEDIRYEVRDGNIYRMNPEQDEDICVVQNGHVSQADVRLGKLWYICQYQIPNSDQLKTTIYRALLNGDQQEEIYSTMYTQETTSFQVTPDWLYYLSEERLFRLNLKDERTEWLAAGVNHYFAWEDTAYYMNDRTLENVSEGTPYSEIRSGYQIELTDRGLALLDSYGRPALENGSGEVQDGDRIYRLEEGLIRSVRPAERKSGDDIYYLDETEINRKIYQRDSNGNTVAVTQQGISTDSICIAGNWLYYSARMNQYGGECESQIYRMNLQTMQQEQVGSPFRGYMRNLYYFEQHDTVFGEYIPSVADPNNIHGAVAKIGIDQMGVLNDTEVRPVTNSSDMIEIVMVDNDKIYGLYHECSYDMLSGQTVWKTTEPIVIDISGYGIGGYGI